MSKRNPGVPAPAAPGRAAPGPPRRGLTDPQRRIRKFLEDFIQRRGFPPSLREIADAVGLSSPSSVSYHLKRLRAMGLVDWDPGRPRTAKVSPLSGHPASGSSRPLTRVPLVGSIAAGIPTPAAELSDDVFPLPKLLTGDGDLIMLSVRGDSMIGAAIADGDWVVVRRAPDAENGDIVAAMLDSDTADGSEATVKTLRKENGHVWLMPQNPDYLPIPGDDATLVGKVVTVLRRV